MVEYLWVSIYKIPQTYKNLINCLLFPPFTNQRGCVYVCVCVGDVLYRNASLMHVRGEARGQHWIFSSIALSIKPLKSIYWKVAIVLESRGSNDPGEENSNYESLATHSIVYKAEPSDAHGELR